MKQYICIRLPSNHGGWLTVLRIYKHVDGFGMLPFGESDGYDNGINVKDSHGNDGTLWIRNDEFETCFKCVESDE